jgi:serine/threonine-protein kinase RsbW
MATDETRTLRVAATGDGILLAVEAFTQFTSACALTRDDVWKIEVALHEWLTNIVEHGNDGAPGGTIDVQYRLTAGDLEIAVTDDGPAFDPWTLPPPDTAAPIEDRKPGGLGIYFIRQLMDRVAHDRTDGHNTLVFAKRVA